MDKFALPTIGHGLGLSRGRGGRGGGRGRCRGCGHRRCHRCCQRLSSSDATSSASKDVVAATGAAAAGCAAPLRSQIRSTTAAAKNAIAPRSVGSALNAVNSAGGRPLAPRQRSWCLQGIRRTQPPSGCDTCRWSARARSSRRPWGGLGSGAWPIPFPGSSRPPPRAGRHCPTLAHRVPGRRPERRARSRSTSS